MRWTSRSCLFKRLKWGGGGLADFQGFLACRQCVPAASLLRERLAGLVAFAIMD
ncbi:hypothetical protein [Pseudomonas sp. IT-347P]|uniref:hypothetical protein n=1 Tax=Pseudomonas sp. IT-347P TaxID=3026458 RepID=UPI0039E0CB8F